MDEYRGFQEVFSDDERLPIFYSDLTSNIFNCRQNEYVLINDADGASKDFYRWDGIRYVLVGYKTIILVLSSQETRNSDWLLICCIIRTLL